MKTVGQFAAQGDVVFRRVEAVPKDAKSVKYGDLLVVAHSETGHHHVIDRPDSRISFFNDAANPLVSYLQLKGRQVADVVHLRDFDTHETVRLDAGKEDSVWEIRRQREYHPERERAVLD